MTRLRSLAPVLLSVLIGSALHAQPFLVEDIWAAQTAGNLFPFSPELVELGGIVFFTGHDNVHGTELWRSDGTEAGTWRVADICAGICSSGITRLRAAGGTLFFGANDGFHGSVLWKSDGTTAGTAPVGEVPVFETIGEVGGVLLFVGSSPEGGKELWRSDGTGAGTFPLGDLWPGPSDSNPSPIGFAGSWLLFAASDPVHGAGLWRTDGTVAGTSFVEDFEALGGWRYDRKLYPSSGSRLFFPSGSDNWLWVSDGTPEGTYQVSDVPLRATGNSLITLAVVGNEVFFSGHDDDHGTELWKSDGTAAGTVRVKDIIPGTGDSFPSELTAAGGQVFFRVQISPATFSYQLWRSDGTEAGTIPLEPGVGLALAEDFNAFLALGDDLVLFAFDDSHGREPWRSDGTEAGTHLLADVYPGAISSFGGFSLPLTRLDAGVIASGHWFFRALTPDGWSLWKSDGTPAGTELVKSGDPVQASGLAPSTEMVDLEGTLLFPADDGNTGEELWRSDGTAPGTSLVADLTPGSEWSPVDHLTAFGGSIYFTANGGLRRTDGTEAGTESVDGSFRGELVVAGPGLYFVCPNGFTDAICRAADPFSQTIWGFSGGEIASQLTPAGSNLFFSGWTEGGQELWKTGGVPGDAVKLDIFPGTGSSEPQSIAGFGSSVFLSADDGSTGRELWFSDGTPAGTRRVKDIVPGPGSSNPRSIVVAGSVAFFIADDGVTGAELWRSDGTAAGTFRVKDILPGPGSSFIQGLTAFEDSVVLFTADDGVNGQELWASYGSAGAAFMVKDIRPGAGSSFPSGFRLVGHTLLFAADDGTHGLEPWRTDGFAGGTFLVEDILPGPEPSSPAGFTLSGDYLYFTANDKTHGIELWALDRAALGSTLSAVKRVVSPAFEGGSVTYEIVIANTGAGPHPDNPGDEMVDVLPAPLALTGASADVGTASVDLGQNRVAWNGALGPGESATVTIAAAVPSSTERQTFLNQATLSFDTDGNGANDSAGVSDDPGRSGSGQATPVVISTPPLDFHTVTPCRVLDTRSSTPLASGVPRTVTVRGTCGVPATAKAVAANLTVVGATALGNLVVYPAGIPPPATSNVNFSAGQVRANSAQLSLAGGQLDALAVVQGNGTVHLILDVSGYYE